MKTQKSLLCLITMLLCIPSVCAENIHFDNSIFKLKNKEKTSETNVILNEYYKDNENQSNWSQMVTITYLPNENNPLKFAQMKDKEISNEENLLLLKFVQNKKQDIAILTYLENIIINDIPYFIYNVVKCEKHRQKGVMVLKYSKKYPFSTQEQINTLGQEVKSNNDDYIERMIISPIPPIIYD